MDNNLILGDCLEKLKELDDNSVDAIVTDPPYHLVSIVKRFGKEGSAPAKFGTDGAFSRASKGFMGKTWDGLGEDGIGIAQKVELWAECLRVLKPGGHLLSFSGTRTYHRMAVAIEDAGFEVRDMIEWVYGCLSFDTEVLTERGFRHLHKLTQYDRIVVYDIEKNIYKWERPQRWSVYKVHQDTAYRIKSDYTDQIVSRNHRCLVEREGKLVFIQADELNEVEYMPTLSDDFYTLQEGHRKLLLKELLWKGKELAKGYWTPWEKRLDRKKYGELSNKNDWREKSSVERWSNLFQKTRKLQTNKVCAMSEATFADGTKRRLCDGTSFDFSKLNQSLPIENGSGASHQSQSAGQPIRKSDVIQIKQGTQITRRARIEKIKYSGIIFCPTVSTGAFIARRNGQVFITGNSGFPKSLNIGKAVDKLQGNEREVVGKEIRSEGRQFAEGQSGFAKGEITLTKGTSEWEGWGTALKPSHEPIVWATKSLTNINQFAILEDINDNLISTIWQSLENLQKQDTFKLQETVLIHLNTALLWQNILVELLKNESKFTTSTASKMITELKILNSLLLKNTQDDTDGKFQTYQNGTQESQANGLDLLVGIVESCLAGEKKSIVNIQTLIVQGLATYKQNRTGMTVKNVEQDLLPIILNANSVLISVLTDIITELSQNELSTFVSFAEKSLKQYLAEPQSIADENVWQEHIQKALPNHSPICMARKPLSEKTVAENVLKYGTGGINIDESRVGTDKIMIRGGGNVTKDGEKTFFPSNEINEEHTGRFPANLILSWNENEYIIKEEITNEQKQKALKWIYENA